MSGILFDGAKLGWLIWNSGRSLTSMALERIELFSSLRLYQISSWFILFISFLLSGSSFRGNTYALLLVGNDSLESFLLGSLWLLRKVVFLRTSMLVLESLVDSQWFCEFRFRFFGLFDIHQLGLCFLLLEKIVRQWLQIWVTFLLRIYKYFLELL